MLLTEIGFEERQPVRQQLAQPYQAWRYAAISSESPCFLIERASTDQRATSLLAAYLVSSPEELLQILGLLGCCDCRVHLVRLSTAADVGSRLEPVRALFSYKTGCVAWFSYETDVGELHPCLSWQPKAGADAVWSVEWEARGSSSADARQRTRSPVRQLRAE